MLVIIPTFQESASIQTVLAAIRDSCDYDVLVVDDGSPDGTADLAEESAEALGGVHVMRRSRKDGIGSAYRAGFTWGLERSYGTVVEMDADLSHDPRDLPILVRATKTADLVIGSRYVSGGSAPDWSWRRHQLSRFANRYAQFMLKLPIADATAGFRAYRSSLLRRIDFSRIRANGYAFQIEMADLSVLAGARIVEIPIRFGEREGGRSKMSLFVIAEAMRLVTSWGVTRRMPSWLSQGSPASR